VRQACITTGTHIDKIDLINSIDSKTKEDSEILIQQESKGQARGAFGPEASQASQAREASLGQPTSFFPQ
jgi:hypothetical protein